MAQAHVASHTTGRLRVRLHRDDRTTEVMTDIQTRLADRPGIHSVDARTGTGSIIVHYDADSTPGDTVLDMLHDVGVLVHGLVAEEEVGEAPEIPVEGPGHSHAANSILVALDDLDRRISRATGQKIDLKMLFPLALGAVGVRRLAQGGLGLAEVPAYVLLWYAFDAFYKLHRPPDTEPAQREAGGPDTDIQDDGRVE